MTVPADASSKPPEPDEGLILSKLRDELSGIDLPEGKREEILAKIAGRVQVQVQSVSFQGPLPPPDMLREYDSASPGCVDRILQMAESSQNHWQEREKADQETQVKLLLRGQWLAFSVAISALVGGCVLVALGSPLIGSILSIGSLMGCAALYIKGEFQHRRGPDKEEE